jgi:hypothetical protein
VLGERAPQVDGSLDCLASRERRDTFLALKKSLLRQMWYHLTPDERQTVFDQNMSCRDIGFFDRLIYQKNEEFEGERNPEKNYLGHFKEICDLNPSQFSTFVPYLSSPVIKSHMENMNALGLSSVAEMAKMCIILDKVNNIDQMGKTGKELVLGSVVSGLAVSFAALSFGSGWAISAGAGASADLAIIWSHYFEKNEQFKTAKDMEFLVGSDYVSKLGDEMVVEKGAAIFGSAISIVLNVALAGGGAYASRLISDDVVKQAYKIMLVDGEAAAARFIKDNIFGPKAIEALKKMIDPEKLAHVKSDMIPKLAEKLGLSPAEMKEMMGSFETLVRLLSDDGEALAAAESSALRQSARGALSEGGGSGSTAARSEFSTEIVLTHSQLDDSARVSTAASVLGKDSLTDVQSEALLRAHAVGEGERGVYEYTEAEIKEKVRILRKEGNFTRDDAEVLVRSGLAGGPPTSVGRANVYSMEQVSSMFGSDPVRKKAFLDRVRTRLKDLQKGASDREFDLVALEKYYLDIGDQIPEGRIRALGPGEIDSIMTHEFLEAGRDFTSAGTRARVGHARNFLFVRCRDCPDSWFKPGDLGSGDKSAQRIPMENLEIFLPAVPE